MCELCVDVAQLNNIPYRLPSVVSLPPKSVRELFRTFFDILAVVQIRKHDEKMYFCREIQNRRLCPQI